MKSNLMPQPLPDLHDREPKDDWAADSTQEPMRRWSAEEIRALRAQQPQYSMWNIVFWQWVAAAALLLGALPMPSSVVSSVAWGGLCAALPSTVMAWGLRTRLGEQSTGNKLAGLHLMRFAVWELVKIIFSVILLALSPWIIGSVNWLALVLVYVVVLKVFWLAALLQMKSQMTSVAK